MTNTNTIPKHTERYAVLDGYLVVALARVPDENLPELEATPGVRFTDRKPVDDKVYQDCTNDDSCGWYHLEG